MNRFSYICGDPGIPIPGSKGASIHVASVCRALTEAGLSGEIYSPRAKENQLHGLPIHAIRVPAERRHESQAEQEQRLFLSQLEVNGSQGSQGNQKPDFVYERYSLWHVSGLARARELGVPFILEVNSPLPDEARRYRGLANEKLALGVARLLMQEADGIVCVSEEVAEWVIRWRGHDRGVWVIPNGVNPEFFESGSVPGRQDPLPPLETPLIAFCGSFRPWHGLDDLLEAFRLLVEGPVADAHLLCVGDGPFRQSFEDRVAELGLTDRVHVTGYLPHAEVRHWLAAADVAVAPYPNLEEFYFSPLKVFEFLALGLPVVAGNIGQVPEIVPHGERGLLYEPGDAQGLARGVAQMLTQPEAARKMALAGREWVAENATWTKRVDTILSRIGTL